MKSFLSLPERESKPRSKGLSVLIDNGVPTGFFQDTMESHGNLVDMVKFGWGTSIVTRDMHKKIEVLNAVQIPYFFGGTLFEKALFQGRLNEYIAFCRSYACSMIEVSDGTISLDPEEKSRLIATLSADFVVLSEVGYKEQTRSSKMYPKQWVNSINGDLAAGATYVITEARESGTSGICRENGELRYGLLEEIISSGVEMDRVIFEAPNRTLQQYFVKRLGHRVNLGNIAFGDVVPLETLRLGLRFDTFMLFEGGIDA